MTIVPDEVEPTIAWRSWGLDGVDQLTPISMIHTYPHSDAPIWAHRDAKPAVCLNGTAAFGFWFTPTTREPRYQGHESPDPDCMCGYWALRSPPHYPNLVVGTVKLWGKVVCGMDGYRSEYAYPDRLYLIDQLEWQSEPQWHREGRARLLGEVYGVECTLISAEEYQLLREMETPDEPKEPPAKAPPLPKQKRTRWEIKLLWGVILLNLAGALFNLGEVLWRG